MSLKFGYWAKEKHGMWANSDYTDLVQPNDGFKTGLLGPADLIAERIEFYREIGVDSPFRVYSLLERDCFPRS